MCKPSHALRRIFAGEGTCSLNMSCDALGDGGWSSADPACKTTAAKFTKCLEFSGESFTWSKPSKRPPGCARVRVSRLPSFFGGRNSQQNNRITFLFISQTSVKDVSFPEPLLRHTTVMLLSLQPRENNRAVPQLFYLLSMFTGKPAALFLAVNSFF